MQAITQSLLILITAGFISTTTHDTREFDPLVELISLSQVEFSFLDSCKLSFEGMKSRFAEASASVSESEIHNLIDLLDSIEPADLSDYKTLQNLQSEVNALYTLYLIGLEVLPAEVSPRFIWDEIDNQSQTDSDEDHEGVNSASNPLWDGEEDGISTPVMFGRDPLPDVPLVVNRKVENALSYFSKKGRKVMQLWFDRSAEMIPILQPILEAEGLPQELVYLSMIESGFNTRAYSWAHAAGPWQFISGTARRYGLEVSWWYDERRDPEKSTHAAAAYLRVLYDMFDDWYLALASYNCGENKVKRHVRMYGDDFWSMKRLPRQTRNYVPTYIAATFIALDPERYGFHLPDQVKPMKTETVVITECVDLAALAEAAGTDLKTLKKLNPAIVRWCTPPDRDSTEVRLPVGSTDNGFWEAFEAIPADKRVSYIRHRVRRGETLSTIADRYGVPMSLIRRHPQNKISNVNRIKIGQLIIVPGIPPGGAMNGQRALSEPFDFSNSIYHVVRRGQTLSGIAVRYGVGLSKLKKWNGFRRSNLIYPGQKLRIVKPVREIIAKTEESFGDSNYIVVRGDTLWSIAKRFGITVDKLRRANGMERRSLIKPGQRLDIPTSN